MQCDLEDISVYYETMGEGRPIVLLHGFGPDHRLMTGCMEPIFRQRDGWQRFYPDLPGMGRTSGPSRIHNSDQMLQVVLDFIDAVIPGQQFALAGESYGGYLARGVLHHRPALVDGLFLLCPLIVAEPEQRDVPPHQVLMQDTAFMSTIDPIQSADFESYGIVQTQRTWERTRDEINVGLGLADEAFLVRLKSQAYPFSFDTDALPIPYGKPTLMLLGRQDNSVGYRDAWKILETYPRATFAVLDRAGHNLQIEQEALFDALVNEWLDRVEEALA
ncbi:MAG: alpha/beta hydrolase [Anaerolineae bacterium]|jgi:pimeloyl-ACP methyl ester carboxylesterase|nr:alpha/beta hydrolase [Anaerolineae bacterium]